MTRPSKLLNQPLAFLITFSCYGHRLPGAQSGSVNRFFNRYGSPGLTPSFDLEEQNRRRMKQQPYSMDRVRRDLVRNIIVDLCHLQSWHLIALHVRTTHVHSVVESECDPGFILDLIKEKCEELLAETGLESYGRRCWAKGGSRRYIWKPEHVCNAIDYVLNQQGDKMATYIDWNEPLIRLMVQLGILHQ